MCAKSNISNNWSNIADFKHYYKVTIRFHCAHLFVIEKKGWLTTNIYDILSKSEYSDLVTYKILQVGNFMPRVVLVSMLELVLEDAYQGIMLYTRAINKIYETDSVSSVYTLYILINKH